MTESRWKVLVDGDGVTISGDRFQLITHGSEPTLLEAVVSELQSVTRGTYGQYCGLSRAAEMVGERWGLLIIRDLLESNKSAADLHSGLPRISTTLLDMRLKELEYSGVIRHRTADEPGAEDVYELTEYGRGLEDVLLALGRWGARTLATPRPEDIVTVDSMLVALRATFRPAAAGDLDLSFELHVADIVLHARIAGGALELGRGPLPGADAVINPGPLLKDLLTGEVGVEEAVASGQVQLTGDPKVLSHFVELFQLPRLPAPVPA